jgi:hypothetical protein
MTNYSQIKTICEEHSQLHAQVIDEFLMYFVVAKAGLNREIESAEKKYMHVIKKMPPGFFPTVSAEFIIGKALMRDGLLQKHINNPLIQQLSDKELKHVNHLLENPWRYIFGRIINQPSEDFFIVRDEILGDEVLIYSPGIQRNCEEGYQHALFFLLIGNNGHCWQTYNLIAAYQSFIIDDIFNFGIEISNNIEDDESFMDTVYHNPFPFFMLLIGQDYPLAENKGQLLRHYIAENAVNNVSIETLEKKFQIKSNKGVYQFKIDKFQDTIDFAEAYYIKRTNTLYRYAMTASSFDEMTQLLIESGLDIPEMEDFSIGLGMDLAISEILKRKLTVNPYSKLFPEKKASAEEVRELNEVNQFLDAIIPFINSGEEPNIPLIAAQIGIDVSEATELYLSIKEKYGKKA